MSLLRFLAPLHDCLDTWATTMDDSSLGAEYTCQCGQRYVCTQYQPGPEPFCSWDRA